MQFNFNNVVVKLSKDGSPLTQTVSEIKGEFISTPRVNREREKRRRGGDREKNEGGKTEEWARNPCRGSFQLLSGGPRCSFSRDAGNWAESLALPASAYVIDSPRRPFRAQLPPPSCHSLGYLRSLNPSLFVRVPRRMKALAATVGTWQGSIIMATAPFPLDFHLLSSPPRLHANTPDGETPLSPFLSSELWFMAARVRATDYVEITVWDFIWTSIINSRETSDKHCWFRL